VLALCAGAGVPVVPQGGNTGLVGGGVPWHGEVVLSLTRLGPVDHEAAQVTAGAGVTLQQVAGAGPDLDLGILIASRGGATVGGAVATNAGGLRVLRFGPMCAQPRTSGAATRCPAAPQAPGTKTVPADQLSSHAASARDRVARDESPP
jgi:FAD/FMN-containing dehydrogenase